jgi:hypothetical protein
MKRRRVSGSVEAASCEVCGDVEMTPGDFVCCAGFLVCKECATKHALKLISRRDAIDEELRRL